MDGVVRELRWSAVLRGTPAILFGVVALVWPAISLLSGALSVILGVVLLARPTSGALALVIAIGVLAILWGVTLIGVGVHIGRMAARAT